MKIEWKLVNFLSIRFQNLVKYSTRATAETPMNAACIKRGPTTGFRHFTYRFAYYIIFPESPKADGKIRAAMRLAIVIRRTCDATSGHWLW
jgi:hypothetical protein